MSRPRTDHLYRGRFAPSPTGPLHFGSLVAAAGSFLQARARGGEWLVRIEDLDTPRADPAVADGILHALEWIGLEWDGPVVVQSARLPAYTRALEALAAAALTFACGCSRRDLIDGVYPGTCRNGLPPGRAPRSVRVRVDDTPVGFHDAIQGPFAQTLEKTTGDFVVHRADGIHAYHLAVVVDDAAQAISEVVRGTDLLDSTPRQIHLQRCLGLPTPAYVHLPVALNTWGNKLSKQTHAPAITAFERVPLIVDVLRFLGQHPPEELHDAHPAESWRWAIDHWRLENVPKRNTSLREQDG